MQDFRRATPGSNSPPLRPRPPQIAHRSFAHSASARVANLTRIESPSRRQRRSSARAFIAWASNVIAGDAARVSAPYFNRQSNSANRGDQCRGLVAAPSAAIRSTARSLPPNSSDAKFPECTETPICSCKVVTFSSTITSPDVIHSPQHPQRTLKTKFPFGFNTQLRVLRVLRVNSPARERARIRAGTCMCAHGSALNTVNTLNAPMIRKHISKTRPLNQALNRALNIDRHGQLRTQAESPLQ